MRKQKGQNVAMYRWVLVVIWMVIIFLLSHESADGSQVRSDTLVDWLQAIGFGGSAGILSSIIRKSAHAATYAILGGLIIWALTARRQVTAGLVACSIALASIYAISDEVHQAFVPGRSGEVRDVLLDTAGATAGVGITGLAIVRRQNRFTTSSKSDTVGEQY